MLQDPRVEKRLKRELKKAQDPFTMQGLIAWLKTKPAKGRYNYFDTKRCLAAQYCRSIKVRYPFHWYTIDSFQDKMENIGADHPWTFGAALQRAKAELKRETV